MNRFMSECFKVLVFKIHCEQHNLKIFYLLFIIELKYNIPRNLKQRRALDIKILFNSTLKS